MNKEDINTFSITFKTTNEAYNYILNWMGAHVEVISDRVLPNTQELYDNDPLFRKLLKASKEADRAKLEYINNHNK